MAALGRIDVIKDDEKMNNPPYCSLRARVEAVVRILRRAEDATGGKVIYWAHVTGRPDEMRQAARQAVRSGATGLMVNVFAAGLASLQMLSEDEEINVPIYVLSGGHSIFSHRPGHGIDTGVFARFVRLLGGDYLDLYARGGYLRGGSAAEASDLAGILRNPWGTPLPPVLPTVSGGLGVRTLAANYAAFRRDILPMAGSAIFGHPLGPAAGVAALQQAAEGYFRGIPIEECGQQHPELAAALRA